MGLNETDLINLGLDVNLMEELDQDNTSKFDFKRFINDLNTDKYVILYANRDNDMWHEAVESKEEVKDAYKSIEKLNKSMTDSNEFWMDNYIFIDTVIKDGKLY